MDVSIYDGVPLWDGRGPAAGLWGVSLWDGYPSRSGTQPCELSISSQDSKTTSYSCFFVFLFGQIKLV